MRQKHKCLSCNYTDIVSGEKKEEFRNIVVCPKCKVGAYVDIYRYDALSQKKSNTKGNTIELDEDINKLTKKLRVIVKHAEALADELQVIDDEQVCPSCGWDGTTTVFLDGVAMSTKCSNCRETIKTLQQEA